jgi:DNA-binding NtrC family response regulator
MFGHVKGAFTDAKENRMGRFELADQGSLFLDEIGNIPLSQQGKLLRVLESQEFERVGSSKTQRTDTRIIAATNANVNALIEQGLFRQDLLYRLNTVEVFIPPLRQRTEDIIPLANHFLGLFAKKYHKGELFLSANAESALLHYAWPGNIRELTHQIERAVVLVAGDEIDVEQLGLTPAHSHSAIDDNEYQPMQASEELSLPLETIEKGIIERRIHHFKGNMLNVAKSLGLSRSAFYRRIDKHKL